MDALARRAPSRRRGGGPPRDVHAEIDGDSGGDGEGSVAVRSRDEARGGARRGRVRATEGDAGGDAQREQSARRVSTREAVSFGSHVERARNSRRGRRDVLGTLRGPPRGVRRRAEKTVHREEHSRPDRVGRAVGGSKKSRRRRRRRDGGGARGVAREASPTNPSRPSRPSRPSGSDDWRRGGAARTLAERGYPSPLAKAAAAVSARARLARVANATRAMDRGGDAKGKNATATRGETVDRSDWTERARTRRPVDEARVRVETNARPRGRSRESIFARGCDSKSVEDSALVRGKGKAARGVRDDARATRVRPFGVRLSERGWPPPRDVRAAISRFFTTRVAAFIREDGRDVRQVQVCQVQDGDRTGRVPSRRDLDALASARARGARAGNVPVVFEYNEGPPPPMPPASRRDEEVREWLRSLRLGVLPREEASELLSNPLRNGVLLSDLMTTLVGAPPLRRRDRDPRSLAVARANVERALVPLRTIPGAIPPQLTWSTEGILKGMRENIFGLLWYVKRAVPEQKRYARAAVPWEDPAAGPGVRARRKTRVARPRRGVGVRIHAAHVPPGDAAIAAGWRTGERRGDARRRRRRGRRLGVERRGRHRHGNARGMRGTRRESVFGIVPVRAVTRGEKRETRSRNSSPSAAPGIATKIERGVATSGYEALAAYGDEGIRRLESSVVRWLHAMGLLSDDALAGSFATLCPELSKGTLLCDLVAAIEGIPVVGVFRPPKSVATARANVRRACERLARHRGMCRRHLFDHDEIVAGSPGAVLALLEDVRVFYDGHPPRTSAKHWNENVPYCPEMGMGRPPPGRDTNPPPRSPGRVLDPMRAMERGRGRRGSRRRRPRRRRKSRRRGRVRVGFRTRARLARSLRRSVQRSRSVPRRIAAGNSRRRAPTPAFAPVRSHRDASPSGAPVRLGASVGSFARPSATRPSLVASSPVKAARDAAAALEGWRASVVATVDRATDGSYHPTVSTRPTRVGEVVRAGAWEASSFPRTRAGAAEVEKSRAERSAAAAAAAVAAHHASPRERETPPRRRVDVGDAAATRRREEETRANRRFGSGFDSATAARAREAERARKRDAEAHARGEGEPNRDRRGARTDRRGARTDRRGARTPPRGRTVGDREGYRSFAPASPGGGVYRPPASPPARPPRRGRDFLGRRTRHRTRPDRRDR